MHLVSGMPRTRSAPTFRVASTWLSETDLVRSETPTYIYHCTVPMPRHPAGARVIYIQDEPESILPQRKFMLDNKDRLDFILTWDDSVLRSCPNAVKFVFGGCWIHPEDRTRVDPSEKKFALSTLVGYKQWAVGHSLRQLFYMRQQEIDALPYTFYRSRHRSELIPEITNNPVFRDDSKFELFRTFQYSLVIENSRELNYFTEKLIDCLITKTIPIYWGCPNIGDYFVTDGMILLETESFDDFNSKLARLTPEFYASKKDAIEENYRRCLAFVSVPANINRALKSIPGY